MILELAQLLCTAHRVIDGEMYYDKTESGRKIKRWRLEDRDMENNLYKATHVNHPSAIWARENISNYKWLYKLFVALCEEFTYRYGKTHLTETKLKGILATPPKNISSAAMSTMPQAMPDYCKRNDPIEGYRNYYLNEKQKMLKWTKRDAPVWV
jgi:hypothetical protein